MFICRNYNLIHFHFIYIAPSGPWIGEACRKHREFRELTLKNLRTLLLRCSRNCKSFVILMFVCVCVHVCVCVCVCVCAYVCSVLSDSLRPHGIFHARILERVAISYPRGSFWSRDWTHVSCVSCIGRQILYHCNTWEALHTIYMCRPFIYRQ